MTSIRKRTWPLKNGGERGVWQVDYKDGEGKRRSRQFPHKKDATAWATQANWEVSRGIHTPDAASVTVSEACDIWIRQAETNGRERGTIIQYRQLARLHIKPFLGAEKLSRLKAAHIISFRNQLLASRSQSMAKKALQALSTVLNEAMNRGLVAQNVASGVKFGNDKRSKKKAEIPSRDELRALISHADEDFRPFILTAISTGLRISELRGLLWKDVDLEAALLTVSQRADKFRQIGDPKSGAGSRTLPISRAVVAELREWKLRCPAGEAMLVFPNREGRVQDYAHLLKRKFKPLQIKAGVCDPVLVDGVPKLDKHGNHVMKARYGFHALRHAAASAWIKQRVDLKRLQVWMGHESIELTLNTYGHLIEDAEGDAKIIEAAHAELFL